MCGVWVVLLHRTCKSLVTVWLLERGEGEDQRLTKVTEFENILWADEEVLRLDICERDAAKRPLTTQASSASLSILYQLTVMEHNIETRLCLSHLNKCYLNMGSRTAQHNFTFRFLYVKINSVSKPHCQEKKKMLGKYCIHIFVWSTGAEI